MKGLRWFDSITGSMGMNVSKSQEIAEHRGAWHAAVHGVTKSQTQMKRLRTQACPVYSVVGELSRILIC